MTQPVQQHKRFMLIDDDEITNFINTKLLLRDHGKHDVIAYTNARQALDYLKALGDTSAKEAPIIIFLDINMPVMDGWEFLDEFQKLSPVPLSNCRIFVLSSSIDLGDVEKAREYQVVRDFISKPLTTQKVHAIMEKTL